MLIIAVVVAAIAGLLVRNRRVAMGIGVGAWLAAFAFLWMVTLGQGPEHQLSGGFFLVAAATFILTVVAVFLGSLRHRQAATPR